mgnify:CR=1 FL=1
MKIVSVDIIDVKNPLQSAVAKWRPVVVRINTDEGVSGFGEVGMAYGVGASAGFGMAKDLARLLIGEDPMRSEYIWDKMQKKTFWGQGGGTVVSAGMSAIDIALWDIKGKVLPATNFSAGNAATNSARMRANCSSAGAMRKKRKFSRRPNSMRKLLNRHWQTAMTPSKLTSTKLTLKAVPRSVICTAALPPAAICWSATNDSRQSEKLSATRSTSLLKLMH